MRVLGVGVAPLALASAAKAGGDPEDWLHGPNNRRQYDLALRFGLGERFVACYEEGARLFDPAEYVAICRAIGVDPYGLLARAEAWGPEPLRPSRI